MTKKLLGFLAVLMLGWSALAGTYYVDPDNGVDATGDGSAGAPEKTIAAAIADASEGDTVLLLAGTYDNTTQGELWGITVTAKGIRIKPDPATVTGTITLTTNKTASRFVLADNAGSYPKLQDLVLVQAGFAGATGVVEVEPGSSASLTRCTITSPTGRHAVYKTANGGTAAGTVIVDNCTISAGKSCVFASDIVSLRVDNCTLTNTDASQGCITSIGVNTDVWVRNNSVATCTRLLTVTSEQTFTRLIVTGNTATCTEYGIRPDDSTIGLLVISDNDLTITGDGAGIQAGKDSASPAGAIPRAIIENNVIYCDRETFGGHGILMGFGVTNAYVRNNRISGKHNYGLVVKGTQCIIDSNLVVTANPLCVYGGDSNTITHNTAVALDHTDTSGEGAALVLGSQSGDYPTGNYVYGNCLVVNGGSYCFTDDANPAIGYDIFDRNLYYNATGSHLFRLGGADLDNLTTIRAAWASSGLGWTNDDNSIVANPLFVSLSSDWRVQLRSPCIGNGWHIGYWHPYWPVQSAVGGTRGRRAFMSGIPKSDFGL